MEKNLISIIIPVYNTEQYLKKCLDSVINQTYTNLEIILIDDGSTDNSGKICDEYASKDKRIIVIHKQNGGVSSARNEGLKIAKGKYIGFVDSDDYIELDMYEYLYKLICLKPNSISMCNVKDVLYGIIFPNFKNLKVFNSNEIIICFYKNMLVYNKLFPIKIVENIFFPIEITIGEDVCFCVDAISKIENVVYGSEVKYYYVNNDNSITRAKFNIKKLTSFLANDKLFKYAKEYNLLDLQKKVLQLKMYNICGVLRQIIETNFTDRKIINPLLKELRQNIFIHLFSKYKISNRLFGLCCCINFNLASKIYRFLNKIKIIKG